MPAAVPSSLPTETVSISAVAAHAGVSVATVSRVMNEQAGVRAPTRDKVLASVAALGYRMNHLARSLDANPNLLADAASLNMPVFVYAVDGDSALAASLLRAQQRSHRWPSGVILDGNPETFCAMMK